MVTPDRTPCPDCGRPAFAGCRPECSIHNAPSGPGAHPYRGWADEQIAYYRDLGGKEAERRRRERRAMLEQGTNTTDEKRR